MSMPLPKISRRKDIKTIRTSLPHTPSDSDNEVFDITAILLQKIYVPSRQDAEPLVKSRLRDRVKHITRGQNGNKPLYANSGGYGILEKLEQIKREMNILTAKDDKRASQIDEHQKQILSLENRVRHLVQSSAGYLSIRRRFLSVYKRDIKAMEELKGSKAIREGNIIAYEGDALGDAILFDRDQRTDKSIYRELYGLDYQQVLDFHSASDDTGLFLVLNAHATMVAQGNPFPDNLKVAFNSFLAKVEEYWLQPTKEPNTPLGSAYYSFGRNSMSRPRSEMTA